MAQSAPLLAFVILLSACSANPSWQPLRRVPTEAEEATLIWVGRGECERFEAGAWQRCPTFDYDFMVEQRRSSASWESVKSLRRLHPDYDGSAGERAQTLFFAVRYGPASAEGRVGGTVRSSLGDGAVTTDREFRQARIELDANVSALAPFDRYRITQRYLYESGTLEEVVELNEGDAPWIRNHERASLFAKTRFEKPPTTL